MNVPYCIIYMVKCDLPPTWPCEYKPEPHKKDRHAIWAPNTKFGDDSKILHTRQASLKKFPLPIYNVRNGPKAPGDKMMT